MQEDSERKVIEMNKPLASDYYMFKFLEIYGHGWCRVKLGDVYSRASYITSVPYDCLKSAIDAIKNDEDFYVGFDGEGWRFDVRADNEQCYFNFHGGEHHAFDTMNKYDLAILIYNDIKRDLSHWQRWVSIDLEPFLNELKRLILQLDLSEEFKNFSYLDELIHSGHKEIVLDSDIVLESDVFLKNILGFKICGGIEIDVDGLVIDGNGHTIDARDKVRIFKISGKNITIKNIVLKNGFENFGGAIYNNGELTVIGSTFLSNRVCDDGGAIENGGKLKVIDSLFKDNKADFAGAVNHRSGKLELIRCTFIENHSNDEGGVIWCRKGDDVTFEDCTFKDNVPQDIWEDDDF